MFFSEKIKIVTHSGSFHADDVFAVATLSLFLKNKQFEIIRTRDPKIIEIGDYVIDVGGIYEPVRNRFDHHQTGGAGVRNNSIPFASFGLVWKAYGERVCGSKEIADAIEQRLVQAVDVHDVGIDIVEHIVDGVRPYTISGVIALFNPTWKHRGEQSEYKAFLQAYQWAKEFLTREIEHTRESLEAAHAVEASYKESTDKRMIVLDNAYPLDFFEAHPEVLYVVYPYGKDDWRVKAIKKEWRSFLNRKDLPKAWAGKSGAELAKITGVSDARFCHNGLFLAGAHSKEGAMKLAVLALEA